MKKQVIIFGMASGFIVSSALACSMFFYSNNIDFEGGMIIGYSSMLLAFSLIFFGIKQFRDKQLHGYITFGKAFRLGLLIALISSTMYVLTWVIELRFFIPDFMERYASHMLNETLKNGASAETIAKKTTEINQYKEMYKNPFLLILLTYMEIFPLGLLITLASALILRKKDPSLTKTKEI